MFIGFNMSLKATSIVLAMLCLGRLTFGFNDNSTKTNDFSSDASIDDSWSGDISNDKISDGEEEADFDEEANSTLCSNLSSNDFSNGCQFWMQGVLLCVVGLGGVLGNSVS